MRGKAWDEIASSMDSPPVWEMCWALPWPICQRGNKQILALTPSTIWLRNSNRNIICATRPSTHDPHKGYKKYPTLMRCMATVEPDLLLPDPDPVENAPPKPDLIEGLSLQMMQAMNHYQRQEHKCFGCGDSRHFARECPHHEAFCAWHKDHLNFQGAGQKNRVPAPRTQASN